jgi:hypothetical protein
MHSKSVASLVALMTLAVASSPAFAATAQTDTKAVSSSAAKPSKHPSRSHRSVSSKKKVLVDAPAASMGVPNAPTAKHQHVERPAQEHARVVVAHRGHKSPDVEHSAEPAQTPAVAASLSEPMVFRTDGKPDAAPTGHAGTSGVSPKPGAHALAKPAIDRATRGDKLKAVVLREKGEPASEISSGDKPGKPVVASKPDGSPIEHEPRLLTRTQAAEPPVVVPAISGGHGHHASAKAPCMHEVVEFSRGQEADKFSLSQCDGSIAPLAIERLSVLVRPESAQRPSASFSSLAKVSGALLAPGVRKIDSGLVSRIQQIVDHFDKKGVAPKVSVISGYRPTSTGSYHATGQALDMKVDGVSNDELVAFCKTLPDTGCGYYPNSSFVHVDVRAPNTGHVYWIDTSGPGETPRYVSSWPPPPEAPALKDMREASAKIISKLDKELPPLPFDSHPSDAAEVDSPAASATTPLVDDK